MQKTLSIFLIVTVLFSCGETTTSEETSTSEITQDVKLTAKTIERLSFKDYVLSEDAEKVVSEWEKYQELAIQINYLRQADMSFFKSEIQIIVEFMAVFKNQIPEVLQSNPINSRAVVLETKLMLLQNSLKNETKSNKEKLEHIKAVLVAFSNLNFQINKKIERDFYDKIQPE